MDLDSLINSAPGPVALAAALTMVLTAAKKAPSIPDWMIPFIAFALGAIGNMALKGVNADACFKGILIGGTAVGFNQMMKQGAQRIKTGPETEETREWRRRAIEAVEKKIISAPEPAQMTISTPSTPSAETIKKEPEADTITKENK